MKTRRFLALILVLVLSITVIPEIPIHAANIVWHDIELEVTYEQTEARKVLNLINEFRTGSEAWYYNDDTKTSKTYVNNLKPLKYDYHLEEYAMKRALDTVMIEGHTFWVEDEIYGEPGSGRIIFAECLAENHENIEKAFIGLKEMNEGYSGQGHRRAMLKEDFTNLAAAKISVNIKGEKRTYYAIEFVKEYNTTPSYVHNETPALDSTVKKALPVPNVYIGSNQNFKFVPIFAVPENPSRKTVGMEELNLGVNQQSRTFNVIAGIYSIAGMERYRHDYRWLSVYYVPEKKWEDLNAFPMTSNMYTVTVEDPSIASYANGKVTGKKVGKTNLVITATFDPAIQTKYPITVWEKPYNVLSNDTTTVRVDTRKFTYDGTGWKPFLVEMKYTNPNTGEVSVFNESGLPNSGREIEVGNHTCTFYGIDDFTGSVDIDYKIVDEYGRDGTFDISKCRVGMKYSLFATGKEEINPVAVCDNYYTLVEGKDYVVTGNNYKDAGKYNVSIKGIGEYKGELTYQYTVRVVELDDYHFTYGTISNQSYTGNIITPDLTIKYGDYTLVNGIDYTLSYENNVNPGTATVYVYGKGNFLTHQQQYWDSVNGRSAYNDNPKKITFNIVKTATSPVAVTSVKLDKTTASIEVGKTVQLSATIAPANASNKAVSWSSNNISVATVDNTGKVAGKAAGTARITVKTADGSKTATCMVTVKNADEKDETTQTPTTPVTAPAKPKLVTTYNGARGIGVVFEKVSDADKYQIWRKYKGVWKRIKTVDKNWSGFSVTGNKLMFTDTTVKTKYGEGYVYAVAAIKAGKTSGYDRLGIAAHRLVNPKISKITATGNKKVTVKWNKTACQNYEVQYATEKDAKADKWTKLPKIKYRNTSLSVSKLKKGQKYVFRIRCEKTNKDRGTTWSEYSPWRTVVVK